MASENPYIDEAKQLFRDLANIKQRLIALISPSGENDENDVTSIIKLIETKTLNYKWRSMLATQHKVPPNEAWSDRIRNDLNAMLGRSKDPIYMGNTLVKLGRYVEALPYYSSSNDYRLIMTSHLQILEGNWSYITNTLGRAYHEWQKGTLQPPRSHSKSMTDTKVSGTAFTTYDSELFLNLALAYWYSYDFFNCLGVLLHLQLPCLRESTPSTLNSTWLTYENIAAMLFTSAVLSLDRDTLSFFQNADPVARYFQVSPLITPVLQCHLENFWSVVSQLSFPPYAPSNFMASALRDHIGSLWLQLHTKVPLKKALTELGRGFQRHDESEIPLSRYNSETAGGDDDDFRSIDNENASYQEEDLLNDIKRWALSYDLDLVNSLVVLRTPQRDLDLVTSEMHLAAQTLSTAYKRDKLVLLWNHHCERD